MCHNRARAINSITSALPRPLAADDLDDPQQNDRANQRHQHGRNGDGVIDRPDAQERADEVPGKERADDPHYDIDQQSLLRLCA